MGAVDDSHAGVEGYLSELEQAYREFAVHQTTVTVPPARYESIRDGSGGNVDLYAKVYNADAEILHVEVDNSLDLPGTTAEWHSSLEQPLVAAVHEQTGVRCSVRTLEQATILGIRDETRKTQETLYRLAVLFDCEWEADTPDEGTVWQESVTLSGPIQA